MSREGRFEEGPWRVGDQIVFSTCQCYHNDPKHRLGPKYCLQRRVAVPFLSAAVWLADAFASNYKVVPGAEREEESDRIL